MSKICIQFADGLCICLKARSKGTAITSDLYPMAEQLLESAEEPLLYIEDPATDQGRTTAALVVVKWAIDVAVALIFAAWVALLILLPLEPVNDLYKDWVDAAGSTIYKTEGPVFLVFVSPLLVITLLAIARFIIFGSREEELLLKSKSSEHPRVSLWTFPVLVDGPFGVVSAAEFIGISLVVAFILWEMTVYTLDNLKETSELALPSFIAKCGQMFKKTGFRLGTVGLYCLGFLFLPVARGSVLLRLVDIPFEQAVRYHVWLGNLTMLIFTIHGVCYLISFVLQGIWKYKLTSWVGSGAAIPGIITLLAGLLIWVTSLYRVRKTQFELFFYTHHLYIVFVVFLAMHVCDFVFSIAAFGIFLFMLDRFLRFCQSRRTVDVISATCLPCGAIELVLSKPSNLRYNALSFIFLRIREVSWLQWHPFSVSSSPLDGENKLSVVIKVLGNWSEKLNRTMIGISEPHCQNGSAAQPPRITASVEGPYGHDLPYHLTYENLVLVAGGIGITPFLAILSDILYRVGAGKPCLPSNVLLVWAIKKSDELPLLCSLNMESPSPLSPSKINLNIDIFVTQESEPSLEEGSIEKAEYTQVFPVPSGCGMSVLVGTGDNIWSGLYVMSSIFGFVVLITLLDILFINRFDLTNEWYRGLLYLVCMLASVLIFGGFVVFLWHFWEQSMEATEKSEHSKQNLQSTPLVHDDVPRGKSVGSKTVVYGSRPNFKEIFESASEQWGHVNIGVIVCGPATLETSVAKECRSRNLKRGSDSPIFHFNSHTFNL